MALINNNDNEISTMERRMRGNSHVRCEAGEKVEIISKPYLSHTDHQL